MENIPLKVVSEIRYLDPDRPYVQADGRIALEQEGAVFRVQTIGKVIATVVSGTQQNLTPLEAACVTYIAGKLFGGEKLKLEKTVVDVIIKCFNHGLEPGDGRQGYFQPAIHSIVTWLVSPEDFPVEYMGSLESLYEGLPAKLKEAEARAAKLTADLALLRNKPVVAG